MPNEPIDVPSLADIGRLAEGLFQATLSGKSIEPPSLTLGLDTAAGEAIRRKLSDRLASHFGARRGYKIGFTSEVIQQSLGIDSPEFGHLFEEYFVSPDSPVYAGTQRPVFAEPEIAFEMKAPLTGDNLTGENVLDAIAWVCPAIELIDSRVGLLRATAIDMIADNVAASGVVLGKQRFNPRQLDLATIPVRIESAGIEYTGTSGNVMGNPLNAVSWLAARLSEAGGNDGSICSGDIIMTGSCTSYVPITTGTRLSAEFGPMGTLDIEIR